MSSSGSGLFKRIISNPEEMVKAEREGKIPKVVEADKDANENADESALMKQLAIGDGAGADLKKVNGNMMCDQSPPKGGNVTDIEATPMDEDADPDAPMTSIISHVNSRTSATNSSLSAGSNEGNADSAPADDGKGEIIARRVSHGSNSSSDGARQPSVSGDYGWFDEMHGYESAGMSESAKKLRGLYNDDASGNDKAGGSKKNKKQGGMLQIESDLMQQALYSIIEPQRGKLIGLFLITTVAWFSIKLFLRKEASIRENCVSFSTVWRHLEICIFESSRNFSVLLFFLVVFIVIHIHNIMFWFPCMFVVSVWLMTRTRIFLNLFYCSTEVVDSGQNSSTDSCIHFCCSY